MADTVGNFMRVERENGNGPSRHFVVHVRDPRFTVEFAPDDAAPDKVGSGVLKRLCLPNSWSGNYGQYAPLVKAAQEFFRQSVLAETAPKPETRRLKF